MIPGRHKKETTGKFRKNFRCHYYFLTEILKSSDDTGKYYLLILPCRQKQKDGKFRLEFRSEKQFWLKRRAKLKSRSFCHATDIQKSGF